MSGAPRLALTRRCLLVGTSRLAILAAAGGLAACGTTREPASLAARAHGPWSDGTWFDDGTGWADGPATVT